MKRNLIASLALCVAATCFAAPQKAPPAPVPVDTPNEQAVAFWVKFDKLPSVGEPTGLVDCRADKDGKLQVAFKALPTEIVGDLEMASLDAVKAGEWHHVEVNFSLMQQRATFYLDGKFQWENDNLNVPRLARRTRRGPSIDFSGEVRDISTWTYAADSERMAVACRGLLERAAGETAAAAAAVKAAKPGASGLVAWAESLAKKASEYLALVPEGALSTVSVRDAKILLRDAAHARKIAETAKDLKGVFAGAATIAVPPFSQDPICPYDFPKYGAVADCQRIVACPGEHEAASFVLMAFRPLKVAGVRCDGLRGPAGAIPGANVDLKLVKRWYRSGSAWIAYHNDRRLRVLVPDLLVNDDSLVYVDEEQTRNYLRLDYPDGAIYADVSDVGKNHFGWNQNVPFKDAETIQPFALKDAGRNQQLLATVKVPKDAKPGVYEGAVSLATDAGAVSFKIALKVLPVELPVQPTPYGDTTRSYITHMNSFPAIEGHTRQERLDYARKMLENVHAHNMNHTTGVFSTPTLAKMALEVGFVPDRVFTVGGPKWWWDFYPGVPRDQITAAEREAAIKAAVAAWNANNAAWKKWLPDWAEGWCIGFSEASDYGSLCRNQGEMSDACREAGLKVFAHGMGHWNSQWAGDVQDMNSSTLIDRDEASRWHAAGGEYINYADPFPGAESPYWYRRKMGLYMYKTGLDGHMLHGFRQGRTPWCEWGEDWGGDGNYRNFCMSYPMQGGSIFCLRWDGVREGYDDLRYLTRLTQLAQANLAAKNVDLRREAKRAMLWIESLDGLMADLDATKTGAAARILILQDAIKKHGGEMPPANPDYARAAK
ncbi:MAG: hypothetical protein MJ138_01105 [Kiritimatiellae bacterium]|nr:hypothetical protein [Kiritimatiellia bacterium]